MALRDVRPLAAHDRERHAARARSRRRSPRAPRARARAHARHRTSSSTTPAASSILARCPTPTTTTSPRRSRASPHVIVESHPVAGRRADAAGSSTRSTSIAGLTPLRRRSKSRWGSRRRIPDALERLHKRMTVDGFAARGRTTARARRRAARVPAGLAAVRARTPSRTTGCCARSTSPSPPARRSSRSSRRARETARSRRSPTSGEFRRRRLSDLERSLGARAHARAPAAARASSSISGIWSGSPTVRTASRPGASACTR